MILAAGELHFGFCLGSRVSICTRTEKDGFLAVFIGVSGRLIACVAYPRLTSLLAFFGSGLQHA